MNTVNLKSLNEIRNRINQELEILGNKAYVWLEKESNKLLNKKHVKIEVHFIYNNLSNIKNYRILRYGNYYAKNKLNSLFKAICVIYNLSKTEK